MMSRTSFPRPAAFASALLIALAALVAPLRAQHSNGFTYYRIAAPGTVDSTGQTIPGSPTGGRNYKTDGTNVFFTSHTGSLFLPLCSADRIIYRSTVTGGIPTPFLLPTTNVEPAEPAGTAALLCDSPVIANGNLYFGADYTPAGGNRRAGYFSVPIAGGPSSDFIATGDMPIPNFNTTVGLVYSGATYTVNGKPTTYASTLAAYGDATVHAEFQATSGQQYTILKRPSGTSIGSIGVLTCNSTTSFSTPPPSSIRSDGNGLYAASATSLTYTRLPVTRSSPHPPTPPISIAIPSSSIPAQITSRRCCPANPHNLPAQLLPSPLSLRLQSSATQSTSARIVRKPTAMSSARSTPAPTASSLNFFPVATITLASSAPPSSAMER